MKKFYWLPLLFFPLLQYSCTEFNTATLIGTYSGQVEGNTCTTFAINDLYIGDLVTVMITRRSEGYVNVQVNNGNPKRAEVSFAGFELVEQISTDSKGNDIIVNGTGFLSGDELTIEYQFTNKANNQRCTVTINATRDE